MKENFFLIERKENNSWIFTIFVLKKNISLENIAIKIH